MVRLDKKHRTVQIRNSVYGIDSRMNTTNNGSSNKPQILSI